MKYYRAIFFVIAMSGLLSACGAAGKPELPPGISDNHNKEEKIILDGVI